MLYQLMNKNVVVATYEERKEFDNFVYDEVEVLNAYLPYGFLNINDWVDGRQIA